MLKLVGDNPFNGVSHLSQEKAILRGTNISNPVYAAKLVKMSLDNGADGFMFSISEMTLSILKELNKENRPNKNRLYAITPAAGESARNMGPSGGIDGLIKKSAKQMILSRNYKAASLGIRGSFSMDPDLLIRSFISLEISKIKSAAGKNSQIESIMLHEIITDLALSLDLRWVFQTFIGFLKPYNIIPGFETRNFCFLVKKFTEWHFDLSDIAIAAAFNSIGFQMIPSKQYCEKTLESLQDSKVIAISPLAAGYLKPVDASLYIKQHPNINGVAIAVSNERQANETFKIFS